ncbi:uncharacterized protein METZ01_LOCUS347073 [marine metagenome]|uniref:Uncharacterized protein n=1 Tax=marine metagenome TaxID=408172 RepID=A0A382R945_9ZZZZ
MGKCNVSFTGACSGDITMFKQPATGSVYGYCQYHIDIGLTDDRRDMSEGYRLVRVEDLT